jgi:2-polyprenyl-3-methyl-5-hydroxy-6-metoxy-1,4-benzoquinol methylase
MREGYESDYREIEKKHPWFLSRAKLFLDLIPNDKESSILDFGCGSGNFLSTLHQEGYKNLEGVDVSIDQESKSHPNYKITSNIKPKKYDIILMMDVLEHIKDDVSCLRLMKKHLKPNGILILSVPAYNFLWSEHDVLNMHYRRYNRKSLKEVISAAEFKTTYISNWNMTLFPFIALSRLLRKNSRSELKLTNRFSSYILRLILNFDSMLFKIVTLPFGLSIIAHLVNDER